MSCLSDLSDFFSDVVDLFEHIWDQAVKFVEGAVDFVWDEIGYPLVKFAFRVMGYTDQTIQLVDISTTKLITGETADSMSIGLLRAVLGGTDMVDELLRAISVGPISSSQQYLTYGKDTYTHGLPTVSYDFRHFDLAELTSIVTASDGEPITIVSASLGYPSIHFTCAKWLYDQFSPQGDSFYFNSATYNYLLWEFYYDGAGRGYSSPATVDAQGTDPYDPSSPFRYNAASDTYEIKYSNASAIRYFTRIPLPEDGNYYYVLYTVDSLLYNNPPRPFLYKLNTGTYPTLDNPPAEAAYFNELLPIIPLRRDNYSTNDNTSPTYNANEEETSRKLLDIINIDYDELITGLEDNPDIALVEDAFMMFAVNLYTTDPGELKVLYDLFENFEVDSEVTEAHYNADNTAASINAVTIREQYFNAVLQFNWMSRTEQTGSIGEIGTNTLDVTVLPNGASAAPKVNSYFIVREQTAANTYVEIKVHGPVIYHNVRTTTGIFKIKTIELSALPAQQLNFNIPLTLDSLSNLPIPYRESVLYKSMTVCIYAASAIELEFYETEWFVGSLFFILQIVSVYVSLASFGQGETALAAIYELAKQLLISYALTYLTFALVEEFGSDAILLILVAAVAYYYSGGSGTEGMTGAQALMEVVTLTLDASVIYIQTELEELQRDMDEFDKSAEEKEEEIKAAWDLLGEGTNIDFFDLEYFLNTHPEESPTDFYERTIHTGNPGVSVLEQIETFHDGLLILPEPTLTSLYD